VAGPLPDESRGGPGSHAGPSGAVEGEAGDLPQQHPEVDDQEDGGDERVPGATP